MAALIFAAYLLITPLAEIGFDTIADELRDAERRVGRRRAAPRSVRIHRVGRSPCAEPWRRRSHSCPASCCSRRSSSST